MSSFLSGPEKLIRAKNELSNTPLPQDDSEEFVWLNTIRNIFKKTGPAGRPKENRNKFQQAKTRRFNTLKRRTFKPIFHQSRHMPCFAIPGKALISDLRGRKILEVGAGSGAIAMLLSAYGCDIVASDPRPWHIGFCYDHGEQSESFSTRLRRVKRQSKDFKSSAVRSRAKITKMEFKKLGRRSRPNLHDQCFHQIMACSANEAMALHPNRDILILMPDPINDNWAWQALQNLPEGRRAYVLWDYSKNPGPICLNVISTFSAWSYLFGEKLTGYVLERTK